MLAAVYACSNAVVINCVISPTRPWPRDDKLNGNKAQINIHVTSGTNWFNTDISVRFAKKKARLKQLHQSVRNKSKFVQLDDGTLGILPAEWLAKFAEYFNAGEIVKGQTYVRGEAVEMEIKS